jgi:hypothetical protein
LLFLFIIIVSPFIVLIFIIIVAPIIVPIFKGVKGLNEVIARRPVSS